MSSDSDSSTSSSTDSTSSSSSSDDYDKRKQKKYKKRKVERKRAQKKKKKISHKDKKRRKLEKPPPLVPIAPPRLADIVEEGVDAFGPALPPHLQQTKQNRTEDAPKKPSVIGPQLPAEFQKTDAPDESDKQEETPEASGIEERPESDDDNTTFGPTPVISSDAQIQLEQRALELKIASLEGRSIGPASADDQGREEWMLELPEVGLKGGLAALANMKRTFYQGKERPDFSDRSSWTKTPNSAKKQAEKPTTSLESLKATADSRYERERDAEQERIAKKHKKKHKREESLVEIHQKKLRKEQKKKAKELAASGAKPERRPFSRDVDLKLNKIDSNQTRQIVDKAKILDSKFSSGKTKYL